MRERITFIHDEENGFDPDQLRLDNNTLHIGGLKAVREDRLTFSLQELPQEVETVVFSPIQIVVNHLRTVMASFEAVPRAPYPMVFSFHVPIKFPFQR